MSIVINTNMSALIAQQNLETNQTNLMQSFEKLSTGSKINSASDNAAGLAISESLKSQIAGDAEASSNIQAGQNMLQIADGGLSNINNSLQRIRDLCVEAANGSNGTMEKSAILSEIRARLADITRIAHVTTYSNSSLIAGATSNVILQVGANSSLGENTINLGPALTNATSSALGITLSGSLNGATWTSDNIRSYLSSIDSALSTIGTSRANVGAYENRLSNALDNLSTISQNLQSGVSQLCDTDIAQESSNMTKYEILQQATISVLAQANQMPKQILSLLGA